MADENLEPHERLVRWLTAQPPYEAVGKVIHAGADLEQGLYRMCELYGAPKAKIWGWPAGDRVAYLRRSSDIASDFLDRVVPALEPRNLLAHGTWMNLGERGEAFVKHDKGSDDLRGEHVDPEKLEKWRGSLQDLADELISRSLMWPGRP